MKTGKDIGCWASDNGAALMGPANSLPSWTLFSTWTLWGLFPGLFWSLWSLFFLSGKVAVSAEYCFCLEIHRQLTSWGLNLPSCVSITARSWERYKVSSLLEKVKRPLYLKQGLANETLWLFLQTIKPWNDQTISKEPDWGSLTQMTTSYREDKAEDFVHVHKAFIDLKQILLDAGRVVFKRGLNTKPRKDRKTFLPFLTKQTKTHLWLGLWVKQNVTRTNTRLPAKAWCLCWPFPH